MEDKMNSTDHPPRGMWRPQQLQSMWYGTDIVSEQLLSLLPSKNSKAYIVTGSSLATKTPLVGLIEQLLTPAHHARTCAFIKAHAPVADLETAAAEVAADPAIDTIISVGGGSPIDSAKWISRQNHEARAAAGLDTRRNGYLFHIAIPTTLSAAEVTSSSGWTPREGIKVAVTGPPEMAPQAVLYDASFARHTPTRLWVSSGARALDHAVETMYHPSSTEVPAKSSALYAAGALFRDLPRAAAAHPSDDAVSNRLFLAAFSSVGLMGRNMTAGMGLSHVLGYALGAPYGIPHGETSCVTLAQVVKFKALQDAGNAEQIARMLPYIKPGAVVADVTTAALQVSEEIAGLVQRLGLDKSLTEYGVGRDQIDVVTTRALSRSGQGKDTPAGLHQSIAKLVESLY